MYTNVVQWTQIRRKVLAQGISLRQVARESGVARSTARKMIEFPVPPGHRRETPHQKPKLGPWLETIDRIVQEDFSKPTKQRRSAKNIWKELKEECGFGGGYTIVKDRVRESRRRLAGRSRECRPNLQGAIPSDSPSISDDPAEITYHVLQSLPKRQSVRFIRSLFAGATPQLDSTKLDRILAQCAVKKSEKTEAFRKKQAVIEWMWKMVQGQATSKSLAEEFGEVRDLKQLLNAVMEGSFRARSRALTILVYQKGISSRALSDLLCISRRTVEKYCRSYRQGGWKQVLIKKGK